MDMEQMLEEGQEMLEKAEGQDALEEIVSTEEEEIQEESFSEDVKDELAEEASPEPLEEDALEEGARDEENVLEGGDKPLEEDVLEEAEEKNNVSELAEKLEDLGSKIDALNELFNAKILHTTHEEKIVDKMHAELQKYKEDMYAQLLRPILLDLIDIRDSIMRVAKTFEAKPEGEQLVPLKTFSGYTYDMQDILEKNNINIYSSKAGDTFVPVRQRAIKKVKTSEEELHGKIADSLSDGYEYMGKTISPEKVHVYFYEKEDIKEGDKE